MSKAKDDAAKNTDPEKKPDKSAKQCAEEFKQKVEKKLDEQWVKKWGPDAIKRLKTWKVPKGESGTYNMKLTLLGRGGYSTSGTATGNGTISTFLGNNMGNSVVDVGNSGMFKDVPGATPESPMTIEWSKTMEAGDADRLTTQGTGAQLA